MKVVNYLLVMLFSFLASNVPAHDMMFLFGRGSIGTIDFKLNDDDSEWLKSNKPAINIGITLPENPPFDLISEGDHRSYEGLSADYISLLADMLQTSINLTVYNSRLEAINDIKNGKIDLLTTSNRFEEFHGLVLSHPYIKDMPTLYISEASAQSKKINTIAMAYDYLPDREVHEIYPHATLVHYPSRQEAVAAAVFGQADAVIIDLFSANYLVNNTFAKRLVLKETLPVNTRGFGFALSSTSTRLKSIIDRALTSIPVSEHWAIKKRWSGSGLTIPEKVHDNLLDASELAWLKEHGPIRVVVNEFNAPITYFDQDRQFHGYVADIFAAFKLYTGVDISITRAQSYSEVKHYLNNGYVDAAILYSPRGDTSDLIFSKAFTTSPYVIVTKKISDNKSKSLRVVIPQEHADIHDINIPGMKLEAISARNYLDAMDCVINGRADATILPLNVADYYIGRYFSEQLKVSQLVTSLPSATLSLVTEAHSKNLTSIMNKFLSSISPDELQAIENRWRMNATPGQETWRDYKYTLYTMSGAAILLIIASLVWAWFTRVHYVKRLDAQRKLSEQFTFMQDIVDSMPHPIYVRNISRELVLFNKSYQTVFSSSKDELLFKHTREGEHRVKEAKEIDQEYQQAIIDGHIFRKDRRIHIDGKPVDIYHWIQPYRDRDGVIQGVIGGWIDVSDRVKLMSALTQAKEQADSASRAKTQFLATMSHEIRTPMNAVIGLLELALKKAEKKQFDFQSIEVAHDSAKGLLALLGDILDVIKIEAGELTMTPVEMNVKQSLESVMRIFEGLAIQKDLSLSLEWDPLIPEFVYLDPMRLKQIISNLIGNAVKFTEHGEIKVKATRHLSDTGKLYLLIQIKDSGIGIPEEELQHLFKPFSQAHHGTHSRGGTGLGLVICRSLCEQMGGTLTLESKLGQGTRVAMTLPLNPAVNQPLPRVASISSLEPNQVEQRYYILIVDDHPANRILLSQQLKYLGHKVDEACNGEDALRLYEQHPYQVVITDCNMPIMDGYALSRRLRAWEKSRKLASSIIFGYTANARLEVRDDCISAGMDDCLFKPISLEDLNQKLFLFSKPVSSEKSEPQFRLEQLMSLIGGDENIARQLLGELLKTTAVDIENLRRAGSNGDLKAVKEIVHKIKGAARIISAQEIINCCDGIEKLQDIDEAREQTRSLLNKLDALSSDISYYLDDELAACI
ncbi:UNVERIFIED_CONTAM: transporter substrate-binding domain-containing protein [Aeromonas hydrophila]